MDAETEPGTVSRNNRHNRRFNRCLERVETIIGPCLRPDRAGPASTIRTSTVRAGVWLFMLALASPSHLTVTGGSINDVVMALPWLATILIAVPATRRVSDETAKRAAARILTAAVRHPRLYAVPAAAAALVSEGTSMSVSELVDARRRLVRAVLILGGGGLVALQTATIVNSAAGRVAETATTAVISAVVGWVVLMPAVVVSVPAMEAILRTASCGADLGDGRDCVLSYGHDGDCRACCGATEKPMLIRICLPAGMCRLPAKHSGGHLILCEHRVSRKRRRVSRNGPSIDEKKRAYLRRRCALATGHEEPHEPFCAHHGETLAFCVMPDGHDGDHRRFLTDVA